MQLEYYKNIFDEYVYTEKIKKNINDSIQLIREASRIFIIGNGGSNAISSHIAEDFQKACRIPSMCFSDPALITCYSNDFGYENAAKEWLSVHIKKSDILIAISSSGESKNIINSVLFCKENGMRVITLTGFDKYNSLAKLGDINIKIAVRNYGVVECFHQIILHVILDELVQINRKIQ